MSAYLVAIRYSEPGQEPVLCHADGGENPKWAEARMQMIANAEREQGYVVTAHQHGFKGEKVERRGLLRRKVTLTVELWIEASPAMARYAN